jgi:5-methylcytosine-specific restriction endonuclease McrA
MNRALRGLLADVKKKKLGSVAGRRRKAAAEVSHPSDADRAGGHQEPSLSRAIPVAIRRAVYERDGGRCTFTNKQGTRCTAECSLEFHHEVPFGVGGEHRVDNIRLLCKPHNLAQARQDYGAQKIEQRIRESRPERGVSQITFPGEGGMASRSRENA